MLLNVFVFCVAECVRVLVFLVRVLDLCVLLTYFVFQLYCNLLQLVIYTATHYFVHIR